MAAPQKNSKISASDIRKYRGQLLHWYDSHKREIPWRNKSGGPQDPYHVWLSEIMCQQTTVQAVKAYYLKFLKLWPTIHDLAQAKQEDVMAAWAGLGYYARARNLHKCAKIVANDFGGVFPDTQGELMKLPGIGDYTSAAIAAIAFNRPATVVDGNVERVIARFLAVEEPLPNAKKQLKALAHKFYDGFTQRPGDLAQAFMDLGAGICIPKAPRCVLCPINENCKAFKQGIAADFPKKLKNKQRPKRYGNIYWILNDKSEVLFHQRPAKGLLGAMVGLPTSKWLDDKNSPEHPGFLKDVHPNKKSVFHTFTHFDLELRLYQAKVKTPNSDYFWSIPEAQGAKMPTVFQKALKIYM